MLNLRLNLVRVPEDVTNYILLHEFVSYEKKNVFILLSLSIKIQINEVDKRYGKAVYRLNFPNPNPVVFGRW